jgi:putative ubiquitin-RnfH superfamily antitoxin RatB of RatAB toxin-antitoxin module
MASSINVEVVYATATQQNIVNLKLPDDSSIRQAIIASGIYNEAVEDINVGVFGKLRSIDYKLQDGDRVEIYSPLFLDPKEARRQRDKRDKQAKRVAMGKQMQKKNTKL